MFIIDEEKLKLYLEGIARGFEKNPFEVLLTILFIILFVTFFILITVIYQKRKQKKKKAAAKSLFEKILKKNNISEADMSVIDLLVPYFPKGPEYINELLTDQALFNKSAKPLLENGTLTPAVVSLLRKRLGLIHEKNIVTFKSTGDLSKGILLVLFFKGGEYRGRIECIKEDGLEILASAPVVTGNEIDIQFSRSSGVYRFHSSVMEKTGNLIKISHSESVERIQNREFFRASVRIPAGIKTKENPGQIYTTLITEISGSGALVKNPGNRFHKGEEIILDFSLPDEKRIIVSSRIVEEFPDLAKMSIAFIELKESVQDVIVRFALHVK